MSIESGRLFSSLIDTVISIEKAHTQGIAVSQPPVLAARENISRIYEEGKTFGGIKSVGVAQAWLTPIAAAHTPALVTADLYLKKSC